MAENTYDSVATSTVVAATTSAARAVASPSYNRRGVRVTNLGSGDLYVKLIDNDAVPPTFASMVTNGYVSYVLKENQTLTESCGPGIDVYVVYATGTGNVCVEELA